MTNPTHPTRNDAHTTGSIVVLTGGYSVAASFYAEIRARVEEIIPALRANQSYTLKMLCGPDFWGALRKGDQLKAGRCMAHMVATNQLPLCFVGCHLCTNKRYRRT